MKLPIYQVDAFCSQRYAGNPAAVCPLEGWLADSQMQSIATENNLSETAFFVGTNGFYEIRWFTPSVEVPLCGHATLASAHVIFNHYAPLLNKLTFMSQSGELIVRRDGDFYELDFPANKPTPCAMPQDLVDALGIEPYRVLVTADGEYYLAVFKRDKQIRELSPDMEKLSKLRRPCVIATAKEERDGVDFVSRMFAPAIGIPEDPVTGAAHCVAAPYWAEWFAHPRLIAHQVSERGGELRCTVAADRVRLAGMAKTTHMSEYALPSNG